MRYILMMNRTQSDFQAFGTWSREAVKAHIEFMHCLNREIIESGEFLSAEGLAFPEQAKIVEARNGGKPSVTDGPFAETKEFLAGYWIIQCDNEERAIDIAARASAAPGPDGTPMNMPIEVREVMDGPPEDFV